MKNRSMTQLESSSAIQQTHSPPSFPRFALLLVHWAASNVRLSFYSDIFFALSLQPGQKRISRFCFTVWYITAFGKTFGIVWQPSFVELQVGLRFIPAYACLFHQLLKSTRNWLSAPVLFILCSNELFEYRMDPIHWKIRASTQELIT